MPYFLGIDVGTSSTKAVIIDGEGAVVTLQKVAYDIICLKSGWSEQQPEIWWAACVESIRKALAVFDRPASQISGIGVSNQMHSLVVLDEALQCVRPSILHNDSRTGEQAAFLCDALGADALNLTKNPIYTGMTLSSLLWIRDHEPENYVRIAHVLLCGDYVRLRLTGTLATDHSNASATLAYDFKKGAWSDQILGAAKVPGVFFPPCFDSTDIQGAVSEAAAQETGLISGTPVAFGGGDQVMQSIGSGAIRPGQATVNIGSGGQVCVQAQALTPNPEAGVNTFTSYRKHKWYLMGANSNAGSAFKWLCQDILQMAGYDGVDQAVSRVAPGADGLVFLPYLSGERCPHQNALLSGSFFGLTHLTDRARMMRAAMEGITFSLLDCLNACRASGASPEALIALGGGTNSREWRQMLSDIFDLPIRTPSFKEPAVLGAALCAAVGVGHFGTIGDACDACVRYSEERIEPNPGVRTVYSQYFNVYRDLFRFARPVLERVTRLGRGISEWGGTTP